MGEFLRETTAMPVLEWAAPGREGVILAIHWLSPDVIYDVESICRADLCSELRQFMTASGVPIRILRPTPERRRAMGLPKQFLYAQAIDAKSRVTPWFTTDYLSLGEFLGWLAIRIEVSFEQSR